MEEQQYTPGETLKSFTSDNWQMARTNLIGLNAGLTDDDLIYEAENEDEFFRRLEQKTGRSRSELVNIIMRGQREVPQEK